MPPLPSSDIARRGIDWKLGVKQCLIAAAAMSFVMAIARFPLLGIIIVPAGGWFAVYLYRRNSDVGMDAGRGARLGAVTGVFGFLFSMVRSAIEIFFRRAEMMSEIRKAMDEAIRRNPDPKAQEIVQKLMTPEGLAIIITMSIIVAFFFYLIMTSIGGAIGGAAGKRGDTTSA